MRTRGIITSLLFLSASALFWSGCSSNWCCDSPCSYEQWSAPVCPEPCQPVCEPACKPVCQEPCTKPCAPACEEFCKRPVQCRHPSSNELRCLDGITVRVRNPKMCMLGDQYPLEVEVHACDDVCDAEVTTHLPEGVSFVRSEPPIEVNGRDLKWKLGPMSKGECRLGRIFLKCECEGELCVCFCATATPVRFCALLCAKPLLSCEKCGPEEVCPGDPINYSISVSNHGSCAAEEVVVTDNVPDGLEHCSCQKTLVFRLGTLAPCETKTVNFTLTALKRGKVCNKAVVTACNAEPTSCEWCTCVCCCAIDCNKVGPKEVQIGKNADYQITVVNTGDKPLTEVCVTDTAPGSTSIVSASGAQIRGNQAIWRLRSLKPGEKANFNITLTTCSPGCFTNRVNVTNCQNCNACCEFTTRWKGRPAINACIIASENPICIGDTTTYEIDVVNQGSEADSNVQIVVKLPKELEAVDASGDTQAKVSGQTVTFAPVQNFGAHQTLHYRVEARGKSSGDARVMLEISSDNTKSPIMQQESTIVN